MGNWLTPFISVMLTVSGLTVAVLGITAAIYAIILLGFGLGGIFLL